jgi:hypothetical protein
MRPTALAHDEGIVLFFVPGRAVFRAWHPRTSCSSEVLTMMPSGAFYQLSGSP